MGTQTSTYRKTELADGRKAVSSSILEIPYMTNVVRNL
jgi:hypothetical protein